MFASDEAAKRFLIAYEDWTYSRQNSIRDRLRHISDEVTHNTKVTSGINVAAVSTSIVMTILTILGAFIPPLAPVLIPAAITGTVMGITATTSTAIGMDIDDIITDRAKGVLEADARKAERLTVGLVDLDTEMKKFQEWLEKVDSSVADTFQRVRAAAGMTLKPTIQGDLVLDMGFPWSQLAEIDARIMAMTGVPVRTIRWKGKFALYVGKLGDLFKRGLSHLPPNVAKVIGIPGWKLSLVSLPLSIWALVAEAKTLHKGSALAKRNR